MNVVEHWLELLIKLSLISLADEIDLGNLHHEKKNYIVK